MKRNIIKLSLTLLLVGSPMLVTNMFAGMGGGMGGGRPCGGPFPPCPVPLDGGISLLLIAGAAYGGKKIYDIAKKNPE